MLNGKDHKTVLTFLALDGNAAFTLLSLPCSIICPFDKYLLKRLLLFCCSIISHNVNLEIRFLYRVSAALSDYRAADPSARGMAQLSSQHATAEHASHGKGGVNFSTWRTVTAFCFCTRERWAGLGWNMVFDGHIQIAYLDAVVASKTKRPAFKATKLGSLYTW